RAGGGMSRVRWIDRGGNRRRTRYHPAHRYAGLGRGARLAVWRIAHGRDAAGTMKPGHWLRAKQLLSDLDDMPPGDRTDWIVQACAGEPGLKAEVERLL